MTSAPRPDCPHRRVRDFDPPKLVRGAPDGSTAAGCHLAQGGVCLDCGRPVLRVSAHAPLGPLGDWAAVAGADPVPGRRTRPHGLRYG